MGTGEWGIGHHDEGDEGDKADKGDKGERIATLSPLSSSHAQYPMPYAQCYLESVSIIGRTNQLKPTLS